MPSTRPQADLRAWPEWVRRPGGFPVKIRLTCTHCHASFLVTDEALGQLVSCPKCGRSSRMPGTIAEVAQQTSTHPASPSVVRPPEAPALFVEPNETEDELPRRRRRLIPFLLGAVGGLVIAALVFWPMLRWSAPDDIGPLASIDPVERTARTFLDALVSGDEQAVERLSTLTDPPALASYDDAQRDPFGNETLRGSFAPIADLNRQIAASYSYDPSINRFRKANPLGVAADFMDEAEQLRQENETGDIFSRIAGGSADEQLDAAVQFAEQFAKLTQAALPRKELVPTYAQLVQDAEPPLPPEAEALALHFGEAKPTWDHLLGRPFFTIEADGPFVLEQAEVVATIRDRLASPEDPARRLRLELIRFRLDAIDTGWKVVAARREDPDRSADSPESFTSPGLEGGP